MLVLENLTLPLSRAATATTGNGAPYHRVGSKGLLERGATEEPTGRRLNKANLPWFFLGYRQPRIRDQTEAGAVLAEAALLRAWLRP